MSTPLLLVDGSSYFFRAFHALPPLTNSKGQATGAIYGVVNMIKRLIKDYQPQQMAVVFDPKGNTFRHEWYPDYKAHRPPMPQELSSQFHPLLDILKAMGLPTIILEGVEADDVIGTLAKLAQNKQTVIISTSDKDMAQLVNANVSLINTMTNQRLDEQGVKEKFGVLPAQFIDYLSLVGDSVDNIPGVTKCGPKTASKWLEQYQTLDNLIVNIDNISGKIGENLRTSLAHLPLSKRLVTIKTDINLSFTLDDLIIQPPNEALLLAKVQELEFKTWLKELSPSLKLPSQAFACTIIRSKTEWQHWVALLSTKERCFIRLETTHPEAMQAKLIGIALATDKDHAAYIPIAHQDNSEQFPLSELLASVKPYLENRQLEKIGYHLKHSYMVLKKYGIALEGKLTDLMLMSYVLNSTARHDFDALLSKHLNEQAPLMDETMDKKPIIFSSLTVEKAANYSTHMIHHLFKLHEILAGKLTEPLKKVLDEIELPLAQVLARMEYHGVSIDTDTLKEHGDRLKSRLVLLQKEAIELAGRDFNLNSPKQLQEIFFEELKLPILAKTPKGQASTAESVLQELAFEYRLPALILEHRSLSKLVSTYIDALPKRKNPQSQRVHTSYNQAVAATGRLSSSDPNLQNIPIRHEEGRLIRKAFIAPTQHLLLAADYSQIELRIMAHLSADENLLKAFSQDVDIHRATASEVLQIPLDAVSSEQRRWAKAINFGLIYGMSAFGLAKQLGIERQDAQHYIDTYFTRYPGIAEYMEKTRQLAHQQGYVETLFGRRLYLPEINIRNLARQRAAERMAINAPLQGTAADIIKRAMLAIAHWQEQTNAPVQMIMQVHDELVFEVEEQSIDWIREHIRDLMENTSTLNVPLKVSIGVGKNWDEAHK